MTCSWKLLGEVNLEFKGSLITDIEGNSMEDGPGIRSVVFFKGCPLDCRWCQNPESKNIQAELWWDREKCIECGECMKVCPEGVISEDNPFFINRDLCTLCYKCVEACPSAALRQIGQEMGVDEIVQKVIRYKPFFKTSGGGVTLSGGEPTLSIEFTSALLKKVKEEGIHTLLETAGLFDLEKFESLILPYVDIIYFDIKLIDSSEHKQYCGIGNEQILNNFTSLYKKSLSEDFELMPRTPLIPGITDTSKNIQEIADFYNMQKVRNAIFLPNNPVWINKLEKLGREDGFDDKDEIRKFYDVEKEKEIEALFLKYGIEVSFG